MSKYVHACMMICHCHVPYVCACACRHCQCHCHMSTIGTYKIDPNLGCDDDAFKADCVKNTKCTCMGCDFVVSVEDRVGVSSQSEFPQGYGCVAWVCVTCRCVFLTCRGIYLQFRHGQHHVIYWMSPSAESLMASRLAGSTFAYRLLRTH